MKIHNLNYNAGLGESDHLCLNFTLYCYKEHNQMENKRKNFFKADYITIKNRLQNVDWSSKLNVNFNIAYNNFIKELEVSMEGCVPDFSSQLKRKNIYATPEAIRKKNRKNKLWRRYTRTKSIYDRQRYRTVKNELRSMTRKLRQDFEKTLAQNIKASPKRFWSYVRSRTKTRIKIPVLKKNDGTEAVTDKEKAETLNSFFSSTFTKERLNDIPMNSDNMFLGNYLDSFIPLKWSMKK